MLDDSFALSVSTELSGLCCGDVDQMVTVWVSNGGGGTWTWLNPAPSRWSRRRLLSVLQVQQLPFCDPRCYIVCDQSFLTMTVCLRSYSQEFKNSCGTFLDFFHFCHRSSEDSLLHMVMTLCWFLIWCTSVNTLVCKSNSLFGSLIVNSADLLCDCWVYGLLLYIHVSMFIAHSEPSVNRTSFCPSDMSHKFDPQCTILQIYVNM